MTVVRDRHEYQGWVSSELEEAEIALLTGDAGPRRSIWSREEPVSVLGTWKSAVGRAEVEELFSSLEQIFSDNLSYDFELVAAGVVGDMAYTVGYERVRVTVSGEPRDFVLRATQIYRREGGEWRVVHRHADEIADSG